MSKYDNEYTKKIEENKRNMDVTVIIPAFKCSAPINTKSYRYSKKNSIIEIQYTLQ